MSPSGPRSSREDARYLGGIGLGGSKLVSLMLVSLLLGCAVAASPEPAAGESPPLRLLDLDDRPLDPLADPSPRPVVFIFVRTDCPIANRYAPELRRLYEDYAESGTRLFLVYADPDETPESIREHRAEYRHTAPALRDPHHDLVQHTGARVTPEAVVFSATGEMVYRGRIDNRHEDYGRSRARATTTDLRDVLDLLAAGESPAFTATRAVGCFIAPLEQE